MTSHASEQDRLIDVTWRSPLALHVLQRSARRAGVADTDGVAEKARRYKAVDGLCVEPWSCELLGRPAAELLQSLKQLSVLAAEVQSERGYRSSDWLQVCCGELSALAMRMCALALDKAYATPTGGDRQLA